MTAELANIAEANLGQEICSARFNFTRDSLVRYAGASGDFNPIHYRDDVAKSVGLPGVLAHGMLTMGVAIQPVVALMGGNDRILDYQVRFTKPVLVPPQGSTELSVRGILSTVEADRARIDLQVTVDEVAVLGKAQVWVKLD